MRSLIDAAIGRSRTTLLLMLMVVIAGLAARSAIPIANEPHVEVPFFIITTVHEGISPADAGDARAWAARLAAQAGSPVLSGISLGSRNAPQV